MKKFLMCLAVFGFFLLQAEQKSIKLAVMEIDDTTRSFDAAVIENATEMLRSKLAATGQFIVIDKSRQMDKLKTLIKEEKKESYRECYDKGCQIPLGQALSADTILRTSISCLNDKCILSAELVDLAKEATVRGASEPFVYNAATPEVLLPAIEAVIAQLAPVKKIDPLPKELPVKKEEPASKPKEVVFKRSHPYLWYGVGLLAAGVGLGIGGIVCDIKAKDAYESYSELLADKAQATQMSRSDYIAATDRELERGDDFSTARTALYISGALAAVGGVVLMIWWKDSPVEQVALLPQGDGAMLSLTFTY